MELVEFLAGTKHDIELRDMRDPAAAAAGRRYGIRCAPAVVIDGELADCWDGCDLDEEALTRAIFGRSPLNEALGTGALRGARPRPTISGAVIAVLVLIVSLALWAAICYAVAFLISNWP